jgi:hypothetical protein
MSSIDIPFTKLVDKRFKIKKLQYNTYEIDSTEVKGQLRVMAVPINMLEVPRDFVPREAKVEYPSYMISFQTLVAFVNTGKKTEPPRTKPNDVDFRALKKLDITNSVIEAAIFEPLNEFIVQGDPPIMVRTKRIY